MNKKKKHPLLTKQYWIFIVLFCYTSNSFGQLGFCTGSSGFQYFMRILEVVQLMVLLCLLVLPTILLSILDFHKMVNIPFTTELI